MELIPSRPEKPAVSVIVPCRNEAKHIENCLRSILEQQEPPGGFEVVVADGMSDDDTREILERLTKRYARLRVVDNPSRITPCGMNRAILASVGQWIAIMGAHNRYAPDYLVRCLELAQATGADNVGGAMICEVGGLVQRAIGAAHHSAFSTGGARWHNPDYEGPAETVFGGFYKRDVFERVGLFDEELVRNQDDEFNLRLTRAGGKIWHSPKTRSWYRPRSSFSGLLRRCKGDGYWKVRVIQKHQLSGLWRHLVPGAFVLALAVSFVLSLVGLLISGFTKGIPMTVSKVGFQISGISFLLTLSSYLMAVLAASTLTARRYGWSLLPLLPLAFACYHVGYGYGFLSGVWVFVIRRKRPAMHIEDAGRESCVCVPKSSGLAP